MGAIIERTSRKDREIASKSVHDLTRTAAAISKTKTGTVRIKIQESGDYVTVPRKALNLLVVILTNMADGKSISLIPSEAEITTQQAADMINVSRPHVVKLLEEGVIPYKKVGSHRRISLEDLIEYDKKLKEDRKASLKSLTQQAQDLGFGYE